MLICYINNLFNKMTIAKRNYTKQRETYIQGSNTNEDKYKDGEAQALMIFNERLVVHKLWRLNGGFRNSIHPFGGILFLIPLSLLRLLWMNVFLKMYRTDGWRLKYVLIGRRQVLTTDGGKYCKRALEGEFETSQELRMLYSVTINCQVRKIVINPGSQLSVSNQCRKCHKSILCYGQVTSSL